VEVICQVRFPPVLRIEADLPVEFQDRVRQRFPLYKGEDEAGPLFSGAGIPHEVVQLVRGGLSAFLQKQPRTFSSADEPWTATLAKDSLALSTMAYTRWERFHEFLEPLLDALQQVYAPAFYSRIGLRYRNAIRRGTLGLEGQPWPELLRRELAGELAATEISQHVEKTDSRTLVRLPEFQSKVYIQHGLSSEQGEEQYTIDNDFFTLQRSEFSNVLGTLQYFNAQAHRLFRWCISDRLHEAMGPQPIP
ncbi:MAG: TIGR04255 family protein, partial [Chloroflexi bacterium]|nr:TIGR04255 family protein [Chloroflexota bacterium]